MNDTDYLRYEGKSVVYSLELEDGYYYVGRSKHLSNRLNKHKNGNGISASWLYHHPFVRVEKIYELRDENGEFIPADTFLEDAITFKMMKENGLEKVRGGNYCSVILEKDDSNDIKKIIDSQDACFLCGSQNHMWKNCEKIQCNGCHEYGHIHRECPTVICWKCGGRHFKIDCPMI